MLLGLLLAGKLLWHLKQLVLQLSGDFLEGKSLNLFCALMKFGAPRWGGGSALDVLIFLLLDLEGPGCSLHLARAAACCSQWELMQINPAVLIHVGDSSPGGLK